MRLRDVTVSLRWRLLLLSAVAFATVAAAWGGVGAGGVPGVGPPPSGMSTFARVTLTAGSTHRGTVITGSQGRTLYLFTRDTVAASACGASCLTVWPPLVAAGGVTAGSGVDAGLVGTNDVTVGPLQATYNGHRLYYYTGDFKSGDANGQGLQQFGGTWYAVSVGGGPTRSLNR